MKRLRAALVLNVFFASPVFAGTGLDSVCISYGKHDYALCLKQLDNLAPAARCPKSEYYRALCLQALHRYGEARAQFGKLAAQKKDLKIAVLSRQGLLGLASRHNYSSALSDNHESSLSQASGGKSFAQSSNTKSPVVAKEITDSKWKVQEAGFGAQGENKSGMPDNWTWAKTSNGCGRH